MNIEYIIHKDIYESGRWFKMSLFEQLGNVGSDVERAISWRNQGNMEYSNNALYRALELLDFTVADKKHRGTGRLKEILRIRECLADYFLGDNLYGFTDESWQEYFFNYACAAAIARGR